MPSRVHGTPPLSIEKKLPLLDYEVNTRNHFFSFRNSTKSWRRVLMVMFRRYLQRRASIRRAPVRDDPLSRPASTFALRLLRRDRPAFHIRHPQDATALLPFRPRPAQGSVFCEWHGGKRRDLVLWVARRCMGLTLAELGRKAGGKDYAAKTMAVRRFPLACQRDKALALLSENVLKSL